MRAPLCLTFTRFASVNSQLFSSVHLSLFKLTLSLLLFRDGVPGSQSVSEEFSLEWPQVLSGMQNVALAWVDGRSGIGRGQKTSTVDPRRLASMRVKDYLGVVESVGSNVRTCNEQKVHPKFIDFILFPQVIDAAALYRRSPNSPLRQGPILVSTRNIDCTKDLTALTRFSIWMFLSLGLWWLFNSEDVSCNREALSVYRCHGTDNRLQAV